MMIGRFYVLLLLLVLINGAVGQIVKCYLSPSGSDTTDCTDSNTPCLTFGYAIETANCTEINPSAGVYNGTGNRNIAATLPLVIEGTEPGVEIDLEASGRFFRVQQLSNQIANFTLILKNIAIRNGATSSSGGAIDIDVIDFGGGIGSAPLALFDNVTFTNNRVQTGSAFGGAVTIIGLGLVIRNSLFKNNALVCTNVGSVFCFGGAIRLQRTSGSVAEYIIEDSVFERNQLQSFESSPIASSYGGAVALGGNPSNVATLTVIRSKFVGNSLQSLGNSGSLTGGGAIGALASNVSIICDANTRELCLFHGNEVFSAATAGLRQIVVGGAVAVLRGGATIDDSTELHITNAILYNNTVRCLNPAICAAQFGGGGAAGSRVFTSGSLYCNNTANGGDGAHIFIVGSDDTELLQAGPAQNVFVCNNSGPAIEPISFECTSPECVFPKNNKVDPDTDICEPCVTITTPTSTPSPTPSPTSTPSSTPTPICDFTEQQILKGAVPQIGDDFGKSVSICGNWSAVSSDDQIYVFNRLNSTQWQFFTVFSVNTNFGELSVEIFNDIIVATSSQAAFVYQFTGGSWMFIKQLFSGSPDFRRCTAVSNDWIVTCSPFTTVQNTNDGQCSIYGRDIGGANNWGFLQTLTASSSSNRRMGTACDIDQSTNSILVTANIPPTLVGYIFEFDGLEWKFEHSLDAPSTPDDLVSASISNDTAVIGDIFDAGSFPYLLIGTVYIFEKNVSDDWEFKQFFSAQDEFFGAHVDLNGDSALAVSSPARSSTPSTVYVYVRLASIGNNWTEANMLEVGDSGVVLPDSTDLSFDGNTLFVGTENSSIGIVNVFTTSNLFCIAQTECTNIIVVSTMTPISTPTLTPTSTSSSTTTSSPTPTSSSIATSSPTPTPTATSSPTPSPTSTSSTTPTATSSPTNTQITTPTQEVTATVTPQPTPVCPGDGQCKSGIFDSICMNCSFVNLPDGSSCSAVPNGVCVLGVCLNQTALDAKIKLDEADIGYAQSSMSVFGGYLGDGSFLYTNSCNPSLINMTFVSVNFAEDIDCGDNETLSIEHWYLIAEQFFNSSNLAFTRDYDFLKSLNDACCAQTIYEAIRASCSGDELWDIQDSVVIRNANYIGFNYYSFEDCHPDHDLNDLVLRIRTATLISDVVNGEHSGLYTVRSTAVHGYPKARGAGFMHQFVLSLSGQLDNANGTIEDRPPVLTECDSKFEQTMKPTTINTTNYLASGPIFLSLFRHILFPDRPLTAASKECEFITDVAAPQPTPLDLPSFCSNNSVGNDSLYIPNDYQTLPNLGGSMFTNTFNGSGMVQPTYLFSSLLQYSNSSTLPVNLTLLSGTFLRFYLRNTDCNTSIDLIDIDPCFLDETFRPWGIVIETPNLWRWPLEGIPVELGNNTGQCVGGDNGGLECMPGPLNCPHGFCLLSQQECRESTNTGDFCNTTSECPFGFQCFDEMGAYPLFDEHYECFKKFGRCCDVANDWFNHPLHGDCRYVWCLCDPPFEPPPAPPATATAITQPTPTAIQLIEQNGFRIQGYCKLVGQQCGSSLECCSPMACTAGFCM